MSSMLFNIAIDWVLCGTVEDQRRGLRWTPFTILEDLDFADDTALLSHTRQHIQEKTEELLLVQHANPIHEFRAVLLLNHYLNLDFGFLPCIEHQSSSFKYCSE